MIIWVMVFNLCINTIQAQSFDTVLDTKVSLGSIAANNKGLTVAIWNKSNGNLLFSVSAGGKEWAQPQKLLSQGKQIVGFSPQVAVLDSDHILFVWSNGTSIFGQMISPEGVMGSTFVIFSDPAIKSPLLSLSGKGNAFALGVASNGSSVFVAASLIGTNGQYVNRIYPPLGTGPVSIASSQDDTVKAIIGFEFGQRVYWGEFINCEGWTDLQQVPNPSNFRNNNPSVGIDSTGNAIITWLDKTNDAAVYTYKSMLIPNTSSPSEVSIIATSPNAGTSRQPVIATNNDGFTVAAWLLATGGDIKLMASYLRNLETNPPVWNLMERIPDTTGVGKLETAINKRTFSGISWISNNSTINVAFAVENVFVIKPKVVAQTFDLFGTTIDGRGNANILYSVGSGSQLIVTTFPVTPVVSSISPTSGPVGTIVTIKGLRLINATQVNFGEISTSDFISKTDTEIVIAAPAPFQTNPVHVTVTGKNGTSEPNQADIYIYTLL